MRYSMWSRLLRRSPYAGVVAHSSPSELGLQIYSRFPFFFREPTLPVDEMDAPPLHTISSRTLRVPGKVTSPCAGTVSFRTFTDRRQSRNEEICRGYRKKSYWCCGLTVYSSSLFLRKGSWTGESGFGSSLMSQVDEMCTTVSCLYLNTSIARRTVMWRFFFWSQLFTRVSLASR